MEGLEEEETSADLCQAALAAGGDGIFDKRSASVGKVEGVREGGNEPAIMSHAEGVRSTRDVSNYGPRVSTGRASSRRRTYL